MTHMRARATSTYQRADRPRSLHGLGEHPLLLDVEHDDRDVILAAERDCCLVHHSDVVLPLRLLEAQLWNQLRFWVLQGVVAVDAVNLGRFQKASRAYFGGTESSTSISSEEGVAGPCPKDHHSTLLQVPHAPPSDVRLRHLLHLDCALHPRRHTHVLQGALQAQSIHHRGKHAHVIRRRPVYVQLLTEAASSEKVSTADNDGHLDVFRHDPRHLLRHALHHRGIYPEPLVTSKRLTAHLEQNTTLRRRTQ
mmetsp:Transcript_14509/g.41344  ORF Transcript_14509/g.41344 Transcript_14509/m.41344 type:complete len:251 (+) Transcript_14509:2390-3142(+)